MDLSHIGPLPVVRTDAPGPFSASLAFRAGVRFATFRTVAVPHLVEHLVMAAMPRNHLEMNAMVDDHVMMFHATGDREDVLGFLSAVAQQIREPRLDRLEHEARIIEIEGGMSVAPPVGRAAVRRYGFRGVGLTGVDGPPARQVSSAHVLEFMQRHLVAENAALVVTGDLPDGFGLELPSGVRPAMPVPERDLVTEPSLTRTECEEVTLSFELPVGDTAASLVGYLLGTAAEEELRHRQGVVYDVVTDRLLVRPELSLGLVGCSGGPERLRAIAEGLVGELRRLAGAGPTTAELATAKRVELSLLDDPRYAFEAAQGEAIRLLEFGREPRSSAQLHAELDGVDEASIRQALAGSLDRLFLEVPAETDFDIEGLRDCSEDQWDSGPVVTGEVFRRRLLSLAPLDTRACIGDVGLSLTIGGDQFGLAWADVVGVEQEADGRIVAGADGRTIPVYGGWFKDADRLFRLIDSRAGDLLFEAGPEPAT